MADEMVTVRVPRDLLVRAQVALKAMRESRGSIWTPENTATRERAEDECRRLGQRVADDALVAAPPAPDAGESDEALIEAFEAVVHTDSYCELERTALLARLSALRADLADARETIMRQGHQVASWRRTEHALAAARRDLAIETETRTALRTQESIALGIIADHAPGVPHDVVEGVRAIVAQRDVARAERDALVPHVPAFAESLVRIQVITRTHRHEVSQACRFVATSADIIETANEMVRAWDSRAGEGGAAVTRRGG